MNENARRNAVQTAIAALLMLFYGWFVSPKGVSEDAVYNFSVSLFCWMLRIGGILLAITAVICFAGQRVGLLLDFIVSGASGIIMIVSAAYQIKCDVRDNAPIVQNILIVVFGVMFIRAASISFSLYSRSADESPGTAVAQLATPASPHPASIRSDALPGESEPPPADGYLAALSKESQTPPTASHE